VTNDKISAMRIYPGSDVDFQRKEISNLCSQGTRSNGKSVLLVAVADSRSEDPQDVPTAVLIVGESCLSERFGARPGLDKQPPRLRSNDIFGPEFAQDLHFNYGSLQYTYMD
jgi:hypothetical protein